MKEEMKYKEIKKFVEKGGNKKAIALKLNITNRQVNRLIQKYIAEGKSAFSHKNKNKMPKIAFSMKQKEDIINLYINQYSDANITHFSEIVFQELNISITPQTINKWLKHKGILSPKARKITKKMMKNILKKQINDKNTKKENNSLKEKINTIDSSSKHPRRSKSKFMGEIIQMDTTFYDWINIKQVWALHLAIDDATGTVVGAFFDTQETLNGYYHITKQIIQNYGIPFKFYTDNRTVFNYKSKKVENDEFTQFGYACHQLGIELDTTSVPQAKGKIERLNQSFKSRLPIELRRASVKTIEQANIFLTKYIKTYNKKFALEFNSSRNIFIKQEKIEKLNTILAVLSNRVIDNGNCIRFKNNFYFPIDEKGERKLFKKGTKVLVIEALDKSLYVSINEEMYAMEVLEEHKKISENFDTKEEKTEKKKKIYVPPMEHPWKGESFKKYLEKMEKKEHQLR